MCIRDRLTPSLDYQGVDQAELASSHRLVLGKHSGAHAVRQGYRELGIDLSDGQAGMLLQQIRAFVVRHKRLPETPELRAFHRILSAAPLSLLTD